MERTPARRSDGRACRVHGRDKSEHHSQLGNLRRTTRRHERGLFCVARYAEWKGRLQGDRTAALAVFMVGIKLNTIRNSETYDERHGATNAVFFALRDTLNGKDACKEIGRPRLPCSWSG